MRQPNGVKYAQLKSLGLGPCVSGQLQTAAVKKSRGSYTKVYIVMTDKNNTQETISR